MWRRRFSSFAIAWLLAAVALLIVTMGSYWRIGIVSYSNASPHFRERFVSIQNGGITFGRRPHSLKGGNGLRAYAADPLLEPDAPLVFRWSSGSAGHQATLGLWPGVAICIALAWWAQRRHRRRLLATSEGRCIACGYDLRATPGRCPECGRVAASESVVGS